MTPLVQETSGSTTGTSLTLTFGQNTTTGNAVIVAVTGFHGSTISSIVLGGTADLAEQVATGSTSENAQIWAYYPVAVNSETIVITAGASGIIAYAYEITGYSVYNPPAANYAGANSVSLDQSVWTYNTTGTETSWTSGATPATRNAMEFVVGIGGSVGASSITITGPPSGGWTNESAIQGVHAGSFYYSAVSGYQVQPAGPGAAYTYSGTLSSEMTWGAATATFLLMPLDDNWGGYVFSEHPSYTGVSATFTLPTLSGETVSGVPSQGSVWVGLGNVYQCGITMIYNTSYTGNAEMFPWAEWFPGAFDNWDTTVWPTKAGDSITASTELAGTNWVMTITNNTENWTYTEVRSALSVNIGMLQSPPAGPAIWPYPCATAEVIVEDEGPEQTNGTNPNYGTVQFTSITTTPAIASTPVPMGTYNTNLNQYPGAFTLSGSTGSFTMYWANYT